MQVLCISTYELGQQPLSLAGTAACLLAAGHSVEARDLSVEPWPGEAIERADAIVFSVPMHTATELALRAVSRLSAEKRRPPLAFVGLYAPVLAGEKALGPHDLLAAGESAGALLDWLSALEATPHLRGDGPVVRVEIGGSRPEANELPARRLLPSLERYARYLSGDRSLLVAAVEASRGCNHSCRHCPVAPIYKGRSRPVELASVLADIEQAVEMGAGHITFADPDFLNRPRRAMEVATELAARHPGLSFDATIKVEHLLRHRQLLDPLARAGLSFVVSAFESTDDDVLAILDKGHTAVEEAEAVALCRRAGVDIRPSWLPFSPWTTLTSFASLLTFSAEADLIASTDPVQYSIRLLLPKGSLLLAEPDEKLKRALAAAADQVAFGSRPWRHGDEAIDELQAEVARIVEEDAAASCPPEATFERLWAAGRAARAPLPDVPPAPRAELADGRPFGDRPRLSEAWFCCAEPTLGQLEAIAG